MELNTMLKKRYDLNCMILKTLNEQLLIIKVLAEDMIEKATNIRGQGYPLFINSRDTFFDKIDSLEKQIESCYNK